MQLPKILLVEDDPADQKLIKAAILASNQGVETQSVSSGEEAIQFLVGRDGLPDLILLDINMPGMGGKELLRRVKENETLRQVPVVILTSSNAERDIADAYRLQAAGYLRKPASLLELKGLLSGLEIYWFSLCRLPQKEGPSC